MFICKMIVDSNDGQITFSSNDIAQSGTTFQFSMQMEMGTVKPSNKAKKRQEDHNDDAIAAIEVVETVQVEQDPPSKSTVRDYDINSLELSRHSLIITKDQAVVSCIDPSEDI